MRHRAEQFELPMRPVAPFVVEPIEGYVTYPLLLNVHYARRIPSISYAFGLYVNGNLDGVITYGTPASATLRDGIAGAAMADRVIELNRLCLVHNRRNEASRLIAASLGALPRPSIVVSFADKAQGHAGVIYQAANFLYCGLSAKRTDWKVEGQEHLHGQTIADQFRGVANRAQAMRDHYGDAFYLEPRSRKHRYVMLLGGKRERREMLAALRYPVQPYPKGDA